MKPFLPVKPTLLPPFVDPNIFIGKKAALLSNLFGTGNVPAPAGMPNFIPPWISGGVISPPGLYAEKKTLLSTSLDNDIASSPPDSKRDLSEPEPEKEQTVSAQRRLIFGSPSIWGTSGAATPTAKPTIVPPGYWSPFSDGSAAAGPLPPVVDPSVFMEKKTKFLNDLFSSLSSTPSTYDVSARAISSDESATDSLPAIPSGYWLQFIPAVATPPPAPTLKPTIVPPGFWIPTTVTKPVGLFGPSIPVVDPAQFVDKKTAFLNKLFSTLNITVTPAPVTTPEPTLDPMTEYQQKVADFLDKLFSAIINNGSNDSTTAKRALAAGDNTIDEEDLKNFQGAVNDVEDSTTNFESKTDTQEAHQSRHFTRRSADTAGDTSATAQQPPVDALLSAKDKVVDTIISEMGGIKNNILETLAELLTKQKEAAATPPPTPAPKKPGPPFGPGGPFGIGGPFGMGGPFGIGGPWAKFAAATTTPKPTPDPEPFQKKVEFLGQVFDTLTKLEKDVTEALNQAVIEAAAATATATPTTPETKPTAAVSLAKNGTDLMALIRSKLIELANSSNPSEITEQATLTRQVPKYARAIKPTLSDPAPTIVDPSFWIPDTAAGVPVGPGYYTGKTQSFLSKLFASKLATAGDDETAAANKVRSIKMAVHQGYQSLPPGTEEVLQAGGGSTPQKHEGGGIKLQVRIR